MENCRLCCNAYKAFENSNVMRNSQRNNTIGRGCLGFLFDIVSYILCFKCLKTTRKKGGSDSEIYLASCWTAMTSPSFAILEIASGILLFFWFGAGFYVGPTAIILSGFIRLLQMCFDKNETDENPVGTIFQRNIRPRPIIKPYVPSSTPLAVPIPKSLETTPLLAWKIQLNEI